MSDRLIRVREVMRLTGLSRAKVYQLADSGADGFPRKVQISGRAVGFSAVAVDEWITSRIEAA